MSDVLPLPTGMIINAKRVKGVHQGKFLKNLKQNLMNLSFTKEETHSTINDTNFFFFFCKYFDKHPNKIVLQQYKLAYR